ncbi:MAG: sulfite exporter TauE/SafE family protein [Myxococcota bacterium]|nr:sulfite exporter TauE/SafE family protein [Myxococcota bacterium]
MTEALADPQLWFQPGEEFWFLAAVSFATAVLSGIVGMAGGITLLAAMLLFLEPLVAIPLHGAIQLVSNSSRTWLQRRHVEWWILLRYGALLIPGGLLGLAFVRSLPPDATRTLIGMFVLLATWAPGLLVLGAHPEASDRNRRFLVLGAIAGVLNVTIGAVGPLIAPFFLNLGLTRQALVGTKAACQSLGHLAKIGLFGLGGFAFAPHLPLLAACAVCVVAGTWVGTRLLDRIDERVFTWIYKAVLTAIAIRLATTALL